MAFFGQLDDIRYLINDLVDQTYDKIAKDMHKKDLAVIEFT